MIAVASTLLVAFPAADLCPANKKHNTAKIIQRASMATQQDERGVLFAMAHEMQQFRLFELPPEIVELLDAPNPPL